MLCPVERGLWQLWAPGPRLDFEGPRPRSGRRRFEAELRSTPSTAPAASTGHFEAGPPRGVGVRGRGAETKRPQARAWGQGPCRISRSRRETDRHRFQDQRTTKRECGELSLRELLGLMLSGLGLAERKAYLARPSADKANGFFDQLAAGRLAPGGDACATHPQRRGCRPLVVAAQRGEQAAVPESSMRWRLLREERHQHDSAFTNRG